MGGHPLPEIINGAVAPYRIRMYTVEPVPIIGDSFKWLGGCTGSKLAHCKHNIGGECIAWVAHLREGYFPGIKSRSFQFVRDVKSKHFVTKRVLFVHRRGVISLQTICIALVKRSNCVTVCLGTGIGKLGI